MTTTSPARHIEHMALESVPRAERNPKAHELVKIRASLTKYGCTVAGIIDERTGRLVAGHGRLEALQQMADAGMAAPDGVLVEGGEWRVPIVRGWASANDSEAEGYLIADNRTSELGGWEERILAEVLDDLAEYNVDLLDIAGYDHLDLDDMIASMGDVEVLPPQPTGARYAESEDEIEARRATIEAYADKKQGGTLTEMILVFTSEEHAEAVATIKELRARDGAELTSGAIVLEALRRDLGQPA